jgi:hypothetical protein
VRGRDFFDLVAGLREGDVEAAFAIRHAGDEELKPERRLADARITLHEINAIARKAACEHLVEAYDAGGGAVGA